MNKRRRYHVQFPSTRWSEVERVAIEPTDGDRPAMGGFLARYLPILSSYLVQNKGIAPSDVDDIVQSFAADRFLEAALLARADRRRGRLRTFLLSVLNAYVSDYLKANAAAKRGGGRIRKAFNEAMLGDLHCRLDSEPFELAWAHTVIESAIDSMAAECRATGRLSLWRIFDDRLLGPAFRGETPTPYADLAETHGFRSPAEASNTFITAKRVFERHLRAVVADYARTPKDIESELSDLRRIVARAAQK